MPVENIVAFVAASFLIALSPGPGTAMVLRQSVHGRKAALATVFGMEVAVACWAVAAALGLSVLLTASEIAFHTLRIAGAVFLIYLGVKALVSRSLPGEAPPPGHAFRSGLIVNLANPKLGVFAISFLPQFVPAGEAGQGVLLFLAIGWVLIDTVWYLIIVTILHTIRGWLSRPRVRTVLEKLSGGVLLALGVRLVLDPR